MSNPVHERIRAAGRAAYGEGWEPALSVSAPGRIELIGNHLDYNGGPVLAAAINRRITVAARPTRDPEISAVFADFMSGDPSPEIAASGDDLREMSPGVRPINYLIGATAAADGHGVERHPGLQLVVAGNLPYGVGISSSAALCVALTGVLALEALDPSQHVALAREAENRTGSPCGAMDQSASVFGNVIRFDGRDNSVEPINASLGDHEFILANSNVVRELGSSSYPVRVQEAREAIELLRGAGWPGLELLAELPSEALHAAENALQTAGKDKLARRLRHVVSERSRVNEAEVSLRDGNWTRFGELMVASGRSSALDYEISHPVVEDLVACCLEAPGVLGARMMGGGEGGSVLALIERSKRTEIIGRLQRVFYSRSNGPTAEDSVFGCTFDQGVTRGNAL